jgi:hypothetical protein
VQLPSAQVCDVDQTASVWVPFGASRLQSTPLWLGSKGSEQGSTAVFPSSQVSTCWKAIPEEHKKIRGLGVSLFRQSVEYCLHRGALVARVAIVVEGAGNVQAGINQQMAGHDAGVQVRIVQPNAGSPFAIPDVLPTTDGMRFACAGSPNPRVNRDPDSIGSDSAFRFEISYKT